MTLWRCKQGAFEAPVKAALIAALSDKDSLAFGDGGSLNPVIGGFGKIFLGGVGLGALSGNIPETVFFMFQMTFAIITPALIVGAYPERMNFGAVLLFSALWSIIAYSLVAHWVWGGGWLAELGVLDFAGGLVVHLTAGVSALVVATMLGSRRGYPQDDRPAHNPGLTMAGAASYIILKLVGAVLGLRVSEHEEAEGLEYHASR